LSPPCSPRGRSLFGLTNAASVYDRGLWRDIPQPPPLTEFVGMTGYGPASFHDLFSDDDLLSEGSSVGICLGGGAGRLVAPWLSRVVGICLGGGAGRLPIPLEIEDKNTLPDPCAQALANTQAHGEDLRQRQHHQPPPASVHLQRNSEPNARNVASGARARACQVEQAIVADANDPPQIARAGQNIAARSDAPTQPARACGPSTAGDPPQHPDVGGACRHAAGEKLHVTSSACSLLPSWGAVCSH
jgi:hypothetical protein